MLAVSTAAQDGTNNVPLDALGYAVGDVRFSTAWGTGCLIAACSIAAPASFSHFALQPGRLFTIYENAHRVWSGVIDEPDRSSGDGWRINAKGLAALADRYVAVSGGTTPTTNSNDAVDAAITRGLPWGRQVTLPTPTLTQNDPGMLSDLLNQVTAATGQRWGVFADGFVVMPTDPTTPTYVINAVTTPGARAISDYATTLYGRYQDSTTGTIKLASATTTGTSTPFGTYEKLVDLTGLGAITAATAASLLAGQLALLSPRAGFTDALTVQRDAITTLGGAPVRLTTVRAGRMVAFRGVMPDPAMGELDYTLNVSVLIGQTDYDQASDTLQLTPVGYEPRDLLGTLTAGALNQFAFGAVSS